jgi:hypothetical protein
MTKAIKGFNTDWTCRDFQFTPGGTYETPGPVKACENGFHAIEGHPLEVFGYYPPGTSRYAEVTLGGDMAREEGGDSKVAAQRIEIGAEISLGDLISRAVEYAASRAKILKGATAKADGAAAQASGDYGAAQASGYQGAAQASGTQGAAQASGTQGAAQASGEASTALASGHRGKVSGKTGCALFLVYRDPSTGAILHAWAGIVGRDGIKPDMFYTLNRDGQPVPTT